MSRPPIGNRPMTDAERQRRHRAKMKALWDSDRAEIEKLRETIRAAERKTVKGTSGGVAKITLNLADGRKVTSNRNEDEA